MIYGIVGSEQAKFNSITELVARNTIRNILTQNDSVVSGECHLGGIDIYVKEIALEMNILYKGYPPQRLQWSPGYKERNEKIAENSDIVICITVAKLPKDYTGMRFVRCYHCSANSLEHVKSGGCWTTKYARKLGKQTILFVVNEDGTVDSQFG
jgi:hypothetical protein